MLLYNVPVGFQMVRLKKKSTVSPKKWGFLAACSIIYVQLDLRNPNFLGNVFFYREMLGGTDYEIVVGVCIVHVIIFIKSVL